jgi:hypothetical protein
VKTWHQEAARLIDESRRALIAGGITGKELHKRLADAFWWGPRKHIPYRVWMEEVNRAAPIRPSKVQRRQDGDAPLFQPENPGVSA